MLSKVSTDVLVWDGALSDHPFCVMLLFQTESYSILFLIVNIVRGF